MLVTFCQDVGRFLDEDPKKNVVAVHCKAGKGRTGLVLCCYLQYSKQFTTPDAAMEFYAIARTENKKGVTIPSQRRWIYYFGEWLQFQAENDISKIERPFPFNGIVVRVTKIVMKGCPNFGINNGCCPQLKMQTMDKCTIYDMAKDDKEKIDKWVPKDPEYIIDLTANDILIRADTQFKFHSKDKKMFGFWLHTAFCTPVLGEEGKPGEFHTVFLKKMQLDDAVKDKNHKVFPEDFSVEVTFECGLDQTLLDDEDQDDMENEDFVLAFGESDKVVKEKYVVAAPFFSQLSFV